MKANTDSSVLMFYSNKVKRSQCSCTLQWGCFTKWNGAMMDLTSLAKIKAGGSSQTFAAGCAVKADRTTVDVTGGLEVIVEKVLLLYTFTRY